MNRLIVIPAIILVLADLPAFADTSGMGPEESVLRKAVESYVAAYNRGDAAGLASHWSRDGEYVSPSGERFKGPDKIRAALESFFAENKGTQVSAAVFDVRLESPERALQKGVAVFKGGKDANEEVIFTATYVKEGGNWKLAGIVEEASAPLSAVAQLGQLEWLIGEWIDHDEDAIVESVFQWANNYSFINGSFKVIVEGRVDMEGTQVIGWDPSARTIRSWVFDSKGGFGEGEWSRQGNRWTVKMKNVLGSGQKASSINIYTHVDPNTFTWQSVGREVDGDLLPNINEVTIVRKEPQAAQSSARK